MEKHCKYCKATLPPKSYVCEECDSRWTSHKKEKFCPRCKSLKIKRSKL